MANRTFDPVSFQLEKNAVRLYAQVKFGATGTPTLVALNSKGVLSVTRVSAGIFTFVFGTNSASLDFYYRLLMGRVFFDTTQNSGTAPAAPLMSLTVNSVATTTACSLEVTLTNASGTATDPASGEQAFFSFDLSNSGAA